MKKKLWVSITQDLQYDLCGLGETKAQAEQAVWNKIKCLGRFPDYGRTFADFRDNYMHSFQVGIGEAEYA